MTHGEQIVALARGWLGTPFRAGAKVRGQGVDCLQLLVAIYEEHTGKRIRNIPTYNINWYSNEGSGEFYADNLARFLTRVGGRWEDGEPGDVALLRIGQVRPAKHTAILSGGNRMIHCLIKGCVTEMAVGPYQQKVAGIYRFPEA